MMLWKIVGLAALIVAMLGLAALQIRARHPVSIQEVQDTRLKLITRVPENNPTSMQALIVGRLLIVDDCVKIGETPGNANTAIWRSGFRLGQDDKSLFVFHPNLPTRYRINSAVRFGGGYTDTLDDETINKLVDGQSLRGCEGPFVFVDSTEERL